MRKHHRRLRSLLCYVVPAASIVALVAACGESTTTSADNPGRTGGSPDEASNDPTVEPRPNELIGDSAAAPGDAFRGSPLCHITSSTCDPDDDGTKDVYPGASVPCAIAPAPDAGTVADQRACRLSAASAAPTCVDANAANADGAKCETGADCAPGFDCIASSGGAFCRRYCCTGSCETNRSQNGAETFCDVQKLQGSTTTKAPVCMPIKTCKLFLEGECAETETCSVVTDDGTTGCVANGSAKVDESCDQEHCSVGLTCLGQAGNRKCFKLCRSTKAGPSCSPNEICKTSTIFTDPTIGVCAPAQ